MDAERFFSEVVTPRVGDLCPTDYHLSLERLLALSREPGIPKVTFDIQLPPYWGAMKCQVTLTDYLFDRVNLQVDVYKAHPRERAFIFSVIVPLSDHGI